MSPGIGIGITPFLRRKRSGGSGPPTSSNATVQAWLNKIATDGYVYPSQAQVNIYTTAFDYADVQSLTSEFDVLALFKVPNQDLCKIPFIHTKGASARFILNGSIDFVANYGAMQEQTQMDGYIDSDYNPVTDAVKISLNNITIGTYNVGFDISNTSQGSSIGCYLAPPYLRITPDDGVSHNFRVGLFNSSSTGFILNTSDGLFVGNRTNSTQIKNYKDGVLVKTTSVNSTSIPNLNVWALSPNNNGSVTEGTYMPTQLVFIASGVIDQAKLNTFVNLLLL